MEAPNIHDAQKDCSIPINCPRILYQRENNYYLTRIFMYYIYQGTGNTDNRMLISRAVNKFTCGESLEPDLECGLYLDNRVFILVSKQTYYINQSQSRWES